MSYTSTESDHNDNGTRWEGNGLKKGPWSSSEDDILIDYIHKHGEGNWNAVQKHTGLLRCGKSCRLRWANHLRPNLKKGAFSLQEERLIVELHAKMGNRWARMAAHLPGRTDNEIKNYWNTRVKKRERAGLPLYPQEMRVEELEWSHSRILGEDRRLQFESCDSNVFFDGLNFVTDASDLTCNLLGDGASSPSYGNFLTPIVPSSKRLRGSEALYPEQFCQNTDQQEIPKTCSFSVPYMIPDSHTFSDGIVPTSSPTFGAVKLELPSFQYSEATFDQWKRSASPPHSELLDPYLQSPPPMGRDELDFVSSYDTGLLDMLLLEAKCRNSSTKNSLYKSCDSTATSGVVGEVCVSQIKAEEFEDSFKSLVYSGISISSQYNADGVPLRQREKEQKPVLDVTRPDVWLASSWLDHGLGIVKETGTVSDALAVLLGDDVGNDYTQMSIGSSSGVVGSCPWSNMPPVCQND